MTTENDNGTSAVVDGTTVVAGEDKQATDGKAQEPTREIASRIDFTEQHKLSLELRAVSVSLANTKLNHVTQDIQRLQAEAESLVADHRRKMESLDAQIKVMAGTHAALKEDSVAQAHALQETVTRVLEEHKVTEDQDKWRFEFGEDMTLKQIVLYKETE